MSTDIVQWQRNPMGTIVKTVSSEAIMVFLAATIPLILLTFAAWYVVYRYLERKQEKHNKRQSSQSSV